MMFIHSLSRHCLSPHLWGLFLVALDRGVYNPCFLRGSNFNRETDEKIRTAPMASVAERNAVGGKEPGGRRVGNSPLSGKRQVQTSHSPGGSNCLLCRGFKMLAHGPNSSMDIFYLAS